MYLTNRERDRLLVFTAARMAQRRRAEGIRLNLPEARAVIADAIHEGARRGSSVSELMALGRTVLQPEEVQPGVVPLLEMLMVEPMFPDGQKLVCVHDPLGRPHESEEEDEPGGYRLAKEGIEINVGRATTRVIVRNFGDRPVQIGSHFHFFEVNAELDFDRAAAFGFRLDIPAGTTVRFEPGDEKTVDLVAIGGERRVEGLNNLTDGDLDNPEVKRRAVTRAAAEGFRGAHHG
ncbi:MULTISPECIES: urease subunit beta [Aminobacter]|uniref:urease subunit beta n=1 Tax=Aminobacter TaxID=31988 RepID=UPI0009E83109|nr:MULTISPECIES: urease subunit beta [Aminobacter]AWC22476.1 Urease subunit alpha [Aminobacter sp. MSH1]MDR7225152.1 urease subunit gamma/beta [Aminobacter aminovorans]WMC96070.1 urease subunit beta [Aminobacter aminovorans]